MLRPRKDSHSLAIGALLSRQMGRRIFGLPTSSRRGFGSPAIPAALFNRRARVSAIQPDGVVEPPRQCFKFNPADRRHFNGVRMRAIIMGYDEAKLIRLWQ